MLGIVTLAKVFFVYLGPDGIAYRITNQKPVVSRRTWQKGRLVSARPYFKLYTRGLHFRIPVLWDLEAGTKAHETHSLSDIVIDDPDTM